MLIFLILALLCKTQSSVYQEYTNSDEWLGAGNPRFSHVFSEATNTLKVNLGLNQKNPAFAGFFGGILKLYDYLCRLKI